MDVKQSKSGTPKESVFSVTKDNAEDNKLYVEKGIWAKVKKTQLQL